MAILLLLLFLLLLLHMGRLKESIVLHCLNESAAMSYSVRLGSFSSGFSQLSVQRGLGAE
jgi:hypothetical protein